MKTIKFLSVLVLLCCKMISTAQPVNGITTFFTNTTTALQANTACISGKTVTLDGWLLSIQSTSNCGMNWTNSTGGDGRFQYLAGFGTVSQLTFGSDNGSDFALQYLIWGVSTSSWTSKPMTFVGYKNGLPVPGATLNATTPSGTGITNTMIVTFTNNAAFSDVDNILFAPNSTTCNSILFLEEISIGTASSCAAPTIALSGSSNVSCNGGANGSATVTVSGSSPFTYTWSPSGGSGATASGLSAGVYTCAVTNSCNLTASRTVTITQPSAINSSTAITNVACNGGNGSATITASGGTGAITYSWSTTATTSFVTGMAGAYSATLTDANNCKLTRTVNITQPPPLVTTTAVTNVACNGGSGSGSITATGGVAGFTYLWSNGATTSTVAGLAGVYTATVTDANNCKISKSAIISQPSSIATTTGVTNVACNGGNGSASITASGGVGSFTYLWSNGATSSTINGLAGVYSATVTDANNCKVSRNITISQPSILSTSTVVANVACNGGSGSTTVTPSGGSGAYSYLWSNGASTASISGMAGVYTSTVTDANNCTSVITANINQPSAILTTTAVTNVACNGGTGSASVTASGGTGSLTYLWSTGATTSMISTALAGVYTTTITDANNCSKIQSVTISQPSALVTTSAVTNVACNGGNGSATVTTSGGTGAYSYLWSNGATTTGISGMAGVYTATVTDANNCKSVKTVNMTQPSALVTTTAVTNVACNGGTGNATLTASGGTGAYTYSWSTGANTSAATLTAGSYTVRVTDANNCSSTASVAITQPSGIITNTIVSNVLCNGGIGSATIAASGGAGSFAYTWSTGATNPTISALAGVYTATVTDANSCTKMQSVIITEPTSLTTNSAVANVACNGGNGSATVTASGGSGGYTYLWSNGATSAVVSLQAGAYTATVTDANSCTSVKSFNINQPAALVTTTLSSNALCYGANGSATLTSSGGTGSYTYLWSNAATSSVVSLQAGAYSATVTDANNCSAVSSIVINQPSALSSSTLITTPLCFGGTGSATITASGGTGAYLYSWSQGATSGIASGLIAGIYTATVTDANSCSVSQTLTITQPAAILVNANSNPSTICAGSSSTLQANPSGGTGAFTYTWSSGATGTTDVVTLNGSTAFTVTVEDANGCQQAQNLIVVVNALPVITVPNYSLCSGNSVTIIPAGAASYSITGSGFNVSPATTTSYSISGTSAQGCVSSGVAVTTVVVHATPTIAVNSATICLGESAVITPSGASTYSISGNSFTVSPTTSNSYSVTGTSANGCPSANSALSTIFVNATPTISVTNMIICSGTSAVITPSGASTYSITGNTFTVTPAITTTYSVAGTYTNGCQSTAIVTISVNTTPTLSLNSGAICPGNSYTLNPTGAGTYSISGGLYIVTPSITSSYTLTGVGANGCPASNTAIATVSVVNMVTVSVSGPTTVCEGTSVSLQANGASSYSWTTGELTNTVSLSPLVTTTYTVFGASGSCKDSAMITLSVLPAPVIAVSNATICSGFSHSISPSGAITYTVVGNNFLVSPLTDTSYSIVGTDNNGCNSLDTAIIMITVFPTPTLTVSNSTVCAGDTAVISVSGADVYSISGGSFSVTPLTTTSYTIDGSYFTGCSSSITSTVTVLPLPAISISGDTMICEGNMVTLVANGASTFSWNTGASSSTITDTPQLNTSYTVTGFENGCSNSKSVTVVVNALPIVLVSASSLSTCTGESATLTVNGASSYTWSTLESGNVITVIPTSSGLQNYSVIGSDSHECINTGNIFLSVDNCTGLSKINEERLNFNLYPNPNNGQFSVDAGENILITISNSIGEVVYSEKSNSSKTSIDIQNLANGIYFIKTTDGSNSYARKFIKQ